ncbi:MAG: hypothetical protein K6G50_08690 [bacterium]|nr:hypothetical protein [bacterium]
MNIKYALISAVLAGACLAAPATAGVTGATGGDVNDQVIRRDHRHDEFKTVYHDKAGVTTLGDIIARYSVYGALNASGTITRDLSDDLSSQQVQEALAEMKTAIINAGQSVGGRTASSSYSCNQNNVAYYTYSDGVTTHTESLDKVVSTQKTTVDGGAIVVGSGDSLNRMWVADKQVNRVTEIDNYITDLYTTDVDRFNNIAVFYEILYTRFVSPIVLDLDGDGAIEASGGKYNPHVDSFDHTNTTLFDFYGNGFPVLTEWVGKNDGLLCRPKADGTVDGTSLFGTSNGYANGFDELASLDKDGNGVLEGNELDGLMVWIDSSRGGNASADELHTLDSLGITSISVKGTDNVGSFVRNGKTQKAFDWWPSVQECRKKDMARK